jgi:hypothetical protein
VTEPRSPVERTLDVFVFAPLGLALSARDVVPKLAEEGRQQVERQLRTARFVGEFAVRRLRRRADAALVELGLAAAPRAPTAAPARPGPAAHSPPAFVDNGQRGAGPRPARRADAAGLAIPGYDSLSASQVVQRLNGLSPAELDAVRAYEESARGRKTILTRVAQLQAAS